MTNPSSMTAMVFDHGLFLPLAQKLSPSFKRMLYFSEWQEGFPTLNKRVIGDGYEGIDRIDDIWPYVAETDLFIMPDIYNSGLQEHLEGMGKLVWGSRKGDKLEINRSEFLWTLHELGLEVPKYQKIVGLSELRNHLKDREDVYIKISK